MVTLASLALTVIVELFTSEGCSSCPPADAFLKKLVETQPIEDVRIIALGEHVDYWDQLGWRDRFSSPALTARQQAYGTRFRIDSVYTPQMVVDGRSEFVGTDAGAARRALQQARDTVHGIVQLAVYGGPEPTTIRVAATTRQLPPLSSGDRADVVIAVTEDGLKSDVKRGENEGKVLAHVAVVRLLSTIGEASVQDGTTVSGQIRVGADWRRENLHIVAFVQARRSRAILASALVEAPK